MKITELSITDMEPNAPYEILYGSDSTCLDKMRKAMIGRLWYEPAAIYQIGAAVVANSGPKVVGVAFARKNREIKEECQSSALRDSVPLPCTKAKKDAFLIKIGE